MGLRSVSQRQAALLKRHPTWIARTLDQAFDAMAETIPDHDCVVTDSRTFSYRDIQGWSMRLAAGLIAAGVKPGEHVALLMGNYPEFVACKLAISRAGAVAVPINFLNRRDELGYVLRQSDAVLLITMNRFRGLDYLRFLDELAPGWPVAAGGEAFPRLRGVVAFATDHDPLPPGVPDLNTMGEGLPALPSATYASPHSLCDIIYTSGTTGSPKGVMITHDMMLRTAFGSTWGRAFETGRRILFSLPMYHVYGYVEGLLAALFAGGAIIPQLKFDAADTLDGVRRHGATDILLIPTMTLALIDEQKRERRELPSLLSMISSGGRSPATIWDQIDRYLGPVELTSGYGMTEVTASSTVTRPDDPRERLLNTNGRLRDVGPAAADIAGARLVSYRVVDPETGLEVAPGEVGELLARGPGVTSGYYNKPEATAEAFTADGWFRTGDLGRIDADHYLTLVGRRKESYRCGGELVMPTEVEDLLVTHPAVVQAHVVPIADERMGEVGVLFVVARESPSVSDEALLDLCRERLARFKIPRHVIRIAAEDIPVTPSGRARKFLLSEIAAKRLGLPTSHHV
ncbi:MAG: acyl--CoA ligase [Betaproteobacteria bacterium]|nr:acyl--CoA ligase [Betaproteobacteria bacterium]